MQLQKSIQKCFGDVGDKQLIAAGRCAFEFIVFLDYKQTVGIYRNYRNLGIFHLVLIVPL